MHPGPALEFVDLGLDGTEILGLHDVNDFDLLLEPLDSVIVQVLDERDGTFSPDDPAVLHAVSWRAFMVCPAR